MDTDEPTGWRTAGEAWHVVTRARHLARTAATALLVGTILFVINQLDVVLTGHAGIVTWIKIGTTYLVPFCVANTGILIASHRPGR